MKLDGRTLENWPAQFPGSTELPAIEGPVACADIDGDGSTEVVACQAAGRICVLRANGLPSAGWPVSVAPAEDPPNAGTIFTRPALGDINGDGRLEIIAAANNYRVHAWDASGRLLRGWPRILENRARAGYADPVLADLNDDGLPEVLVATDQGFRGPARIYALDVAGRDIRGWPVDLPERCNAGVAVGDLDNDGRLDVVAATVGEQGWVLAWDGRGRLRRGFPVGLAQLSVNASPVLADVDGDSRTDIIVAALRTRFEPAAYLVALDREGRPLPGLSFHDGRLRGRQRGSGGRRHRRRRPARSSCSGRRCRGGSSHGIFSARHSRPVLHGLGPASMRETRAPTMRRARAGRRVRAAEAPATTPAEGPQPEISFPPLGSIPFVLAGEGRVRLAVINVQGIEVRTLLDTTLPMGSYTIVWDGKDGLGHPLPAGVYIYDLETPGRRVKGQLLLLK